MRCLSRIAAVIIASSLPGSIAAPAIAHAQLHADSGYADVDRGRIYYESAGAGEAVVLIHGGFGDRRMWGVQMPQLTRSYRVIRYDHRGFGRSPEPDTAYSPTDDLLRLLDHLGIDRAHIVGNSVGGGVALDFAVLHPSRVRSVTAIASGANGYPYDDADFARMRQVFAIGATNVDSAATLWLQDPMIAVASRNPGTAAIVRRMVQENRSVFHMSDWPWETLKPASYDRLSDLRMPVLIVIGDLDIAPVQRAAAATAARIRHAQLFRVPGADHLPHMVEPAAFNHRLLTFLRAASAAGSGVRPDA